MAQNHMKQQVDQGHSERQFAEGGHVFLHLQPYKQTSLKANHCQKLAPKFYGPYTIVITNLFMLYILTSGTLQRSKNRSSKGNLLELYG